MHKCYSAPVQASLQWTGSKIFYWMFDTTDKTRQDLTKLITTCTGHFEVVCKSCSMSCRVALWECVLEEELWPNLFPRASPHPFSEGKPWIFTQYLTQTWKWLIMEATTLHRPNNKRYLKLTSMSSSIIKKVIYLPPVSAASWQRNWLASVSAQLKEMVWMGTGFKSWTWASMDDGGWKGKVKGVKIYIVCCNRDLIWSDNRDVRENVAEKYISHPFKPFRDYPKSPCYLKEGNLG